MSKRRERALPERATKLGRYLFSLRIQRGFANISEYLRDYPITISDMYYRDIESGKKKLGLESADILCTEMRAERRVFYYHYLSDQLPEDMVAALLRPIADETFSSLEERQALLERDKRVYREAFAQAMLAESHVLSDAALELLLGRPELMPVLHFVYGVESASGKQLASVLERNAIPDRAIDVAILFERVGLAVIEGDRSGRRGWTFRRRSRVSRAPLTEAGKRLKLNFVTREVAKTLTQPALDRTWAGVGAFVETQIVELPPQVVENARVRALDFLAEVSAGGEAASRGRSRPYFVGIFFGSREEYGPELKE